MLDMYRLKVIAKNILAALLIASLSLHLGLFQSVAWICMMVKYSVTDSIAKSIEKTFDGKHPCALCKIVDESKKAEQQKNGPAPKLVTHIDFFFTYQSFTLYAPPVFHQFPSVRQEIYRQESPPTPPPRII